jgi:hypothetical protein
MAACMAQKTQGTPDIDFHTCTCGRDAGHETDPDPYWQQHQCDSDAQRWGP